jgi:DNA modification methylase
LSKFPPAAIKREEIIGECRLLLGDCLEIMPQLGEFDAVVTDPPYGIGESSKNFASRGKIADAAKYERESWDSQTAPEAIAKAREIAQAAIIFGGNYYDLPPASCWLVWDKENGANDFADCELAWTNLPRAVRRLKFLWNGCMRKEREIAREHPTQKPVGVMRWCLGFVLDAKTILDPFMGSGTTGVACAQLDRAFTGIELNEKYFDIACRRIEEAYKQPRLFPAEKPKEPPQPSMFDGAAE